MTAVSELTQYVEDRRQERTEVVEARVVKYKGQYITVDSTDCASLTDVRGLRETFAIGSRIKVAYARGSGVGAGQIGSVVEPTRRANASGSILPLEARFPGDPAPLGLDIAPRIAYADPPNIFPGEITRHEIVGYDLDIGFFSVVEPDPGFDLFEVVKLGAGGVYNVDPRVTISDLEHVLRPDLVQFGQVSVKMTLTAAANLSPFGLLLPMRVTRKP